MTDQADPTTKPWRIQRMRTKGWRMPEGTIYVGRPTVWGNGFHVGSTGWRPAPDCPETGRWDKIDRNPLTIETAVEAYRRSELWAMRDEDYAARLRFALAGRDLACWCPLSRPCHADILLELANNTPSKREG